MSPAGLSISHYLCPPGYGAIRFMTEAASAGAGGVGLTIAALDELGAAGCRRAASANGLAITSLNSGGNLTLREAAAMRDEAARNRRLIDAAAEMGAGVLVLVTGGLAGQRFSDDGAVHAGPIWRAADAAAQLHGQIAPLVAHATAAGVRLAVEPIHPVDVLYKGVVTSIARGAALTDRIEGLGLMLDVYHSWWDPDFATPPSATAGLQICGIRQGDALSRPDRDLLGAGIVDVRPFIDAVRRHAPDAFIEFELFDRHRRGRAVADIIGATMTAWSALQQTSVSAMPVCDSAGRRGAER